MLIPGGGGASLPVPATPTPHEGTRALKITPLALGELPRGLPRAHPSRALGAVTVLMTKPRRIAQAGRVLKQAQSSQFAIRAILMREPRQVVEAPSLLLAGAMLRRQRGQDRG